MKKNLVSHKLCIICGKSSEDGIIINSKRICSKCEGRLINCEIGTDFYDYYKNCIKTKIVKEKIIMDKDINEHI